MDWIGMAGVEGQNIPRNQGIQVIARAAGILRLLGRETDGLSLGRIAKAVGLPRSTVQRIVSALAVEGFVSSSNGYGGIRLGPEIRSLAQTSTSGMADRLRPVMKRISDETGETVDLAVLENGRMLFIDQVVGRQRLRTVSSIGAKFPLTTTANGKAALACLNQSHAAKLIFAETEDQGRDARPIFDIVAEINDIRAGALAKDEDEHTEGISALGFAVSDRHGDVFAVSTPVPSTRYGRVKEALSETIRKCRGEFDLEAEPQD